MKICYEFTNFTVRTYKHEQYLSMPKSDATIQEIGDIGDVAQDDLPMADEVIFNATIMAAMLHTYSSCVAGCGGKLNSLNSGTLNVCGKCKLEQLSDNTVTKISATSSGNKQYNLTGFHNILAAIVHPEEAITTTNLIQASQFTCYFENKVISSISRV